MNGEVANVLAHTFDTRQPRFAARQRLHTFRIGRVPMVIGKRDERFEGGRGARRGDVLAIIEDRAVGRHKAGLEHPPAGSAVPGQATPERPASPQETKPAKPARIDGTVLRLSPDELVRLAPRLRGYLATPAPSWPDVVDAADWLRGELGVSKPLWGEACLAMGREEAAIAVAIVSAKPADHFRSSPGGYFYGMVAKAKAGELNLARTIWGLRARDRKAGEGRSPRRAN